jgi:hypothetical protein
MKTTTLAASVLISLLGLNAAAPGRAAAQRPVSAKESATETKASAKSSITYRLEFVWSEFQKGKRVNSREYSMLAQEGAWGRLRAGTKVPVAVSDKQFQYMNVGMDMDCRPQTAGDKVLLTVSAESTSFFLPASSSTAAAPAAGEPTFRQNPVLRTMRANVESLVTPGKPTVISTLDDPSSDRRFELQVTAVPVP